MEVNMNTDSAVNSLPSDTIGSIIFEFQAQPGSNKVSENGEGVISERTGDQVAHVVFGPPVSHNDPDVSPQISSKNGVYCSSRTVATQETSRSNVVEQIKNCVAKRTTLTSTSKSQQLPSISKSQQPSISKPKESSISKPRQSNLVDLSKPSMIRLRIQNGQVVQNIHYVDIHATQADRQETQDDRKTTNIKPLKKGEKTANNYSSKQMEGPQITSSTKLALLNFLKKKYAGNTSETSSKSGRDDVDPEMQIISTVGEANNASEEDTSTCSDQANNIEKDVDTINVPARTKSEIDPEIISIAESSSPEQSNENPDQSPVELTLTSTGVQSDNTDQPSTQQSGVAGVNDESDKEMKQGDNNSSISTEESCVQVENTTSDVELCDKFTTTIQEVDVVMLPSLMQPDVSKQAVKRCGEVQKQETGIKKKTRKQTRKPHECKECGKMLSSSSKYSNHMNIHYDRRPFNCNECGKSFRQRHHLSKHALLHTGEKPYVCQYCEKAFVSRYNCRDHERIHTGEKPCKCAHCDETFRCSQAVKEHEKSAHNLHLKCGNLVPEKKVYTCNVCDKTFSWSSALSLHKKRHKDEWGYKCNKCSKTFKNNSALWNHKRTHSKEKPFQCDLCGQRLKRRGNLKRHILTQHKAEEAEECLKTSKQFEHLRAKNN